MHVIRKEISLRLSIGVSAKVVQRIGRDLFDLKARGDINLNNPV